MKLLHYSSPTGLWHALKGPTKVCLVDGWPSLIQDVPTTYDGKGALGTLRWVDYKAGEARIVTLRAEDISKVIADAVSVQIYFEGSPDVPLEIQFLTLEDPEKAMRGLVRYGFVFRPVCIHGKDSSRPL